MIRLLLLVMLVIFILIEFSGCADPYAVCVETEQRAYASAHPEMSYSQLVFKRKEFERGCMK